ncbi:MAG TPA: MlaD family protein [Solirubrobacterales bacterium]|nr:MlaD family protein [Solirubrobacterales bacterium]
MAAVVVAIVLVSSSGGGNSAYLVRAVFDNGSFMVSGEQVRVAGANVGEIKSVGVSMPGEIDSYKNGKPQAIPGKAIIVMEITNPGFQDFRSDAGCLIRPQSLIGEKFIDCNPTLPRAPGSQPAPSLKKIPSGQPGAGQYLLPVENNSTSVDPDLINDIQTLPYAQRFRLILNELGAGLAGRGKDIEEVVKRANPVLRDVDRLFAILSAQRNQLAKLASNSEEILRPFSRVRAHVAGFFANAGAAGQASSERGPELEASLRKFPRFLRQFRLTMHSLQGFSDAATPVFADFGKAAPSLTDATRALTPFSAASTVALKSLGASGAIAGPKLREADPIVRKTTELAKSGAGPTTNLAKFFVNIEKTGGWNGLVDLIYNTTATLNGFDQYGHFGRTLVTLTNCVDYVVQPESGCVANFTGEGAVTSATISSADLYRRLEHQLEGQTGGTGAGASASESSPSPKAGQAGGPGPGAKTGGTAPLLNYLLAP